MGVHTTDWIAAAGFIRVETIFYRALVKVAYNPSSSEKDRGVVTLNGYFKWLL